MDLDLLRDAVGDQLMNYYGVSYGTILGAVYANIFPQKVNKKQWIFKPRGMIGLLADAFWMSIIHSDKNVALIIAPFDCRLAITELMLFVYATPLRTAYPFRLAPWPLMGTLNPASTSSARVCHLCRSACRVTRPLLKFLTNGSIAVVQLIQVLLETVVSSRAGRTTRCVQTLMIDKRLNNTTSYSFDLILNPDPCLSDPEEVEPAPGGGQTPRLHQPERHHPLRRCLPQGIRRACPAQAADGISNVRIS